MWTLTLFFRYFPVVLREHACDMLVMCPPCQQISDQHDAVFRQVLAEECDADYTSSRLLEDQELLQVRSAAKYVTIGRTLRSLHV